MEGECEGVTCEVDLSWSAHRVVCAGIELVFYSLFNGARNY